MTEVVVSDPEQVRDIHILRDGVIELVGTDGSRIVKIPIMVLERFNQGPLAAFDIASDAAIHVLNGSENYLRIWYDKGQHWVRLMVFDDHVFAFDEHQGSRFNVTHIAAPQASASV